MAKFIITSSKPKVFHFNLQASNGEVILSSESYTTKDSCLKGIESVKSNAPDPAKYSIFESKDGRFYFTLKAGNNKVIGTSQMYKSLPNLNTGIASLQKNAPIARVEDKTVK